MEVSAFVHGEWATYDQRLNLTETVDNVVVEVTHEQDTYITDVASVSIPKPDFVRFFSQAVDSIKYRINE